MSFQTPKEVDDALLAFPATVIGTLLPRWEDIPVEFRERQSIQCRRFEELLHGRGQLRVRIRENIDPQLAVRHLKAVLNSYEPKHEHKMAGACYLMSLWYVLEEDPDIS